jgi:prevent-host-death family protein
MDDTPQRLDQRIGAYQAKTRFSELVARAEKGESFIVTKHGRDVARIDPPQGDERNQVRQAIEALRRFRGAQGPQVSEAEAQRNYEDMKKGLEAEDDQRTDRWISSSTPR